MILNIPQKMPFIDDGNSKPVGSYQNSGIDVLIVGTGLGGLTAALECTRKAHKVRLLERFDDINTAGLCPWTLLHGH